MEFDNALRDAEEARLAVERKWFEGVRPECRPSDQDISRMKARYHYNPEFFHIAVVGSAGAGKSSFINAVRGLSKQHPMAASTGIVETTDTVTRYPDPSPISQMIWYDVPGAGTPKVSDWQYFNDMGLYIFDCIIVLTDNRVLESDLTILRACEQFKNIKSFIVRSKSDQYINNMVCERMPPGFDIGDPDMDDETRSLFLQTKSEERHWFINETCQNVRMHLERENLPPKKVYIVCSDAMLAIVNKSRSSKAIDEAELLNDVKGSCGSVRGRGVESKSSLLDCQSDPRLAVERKWFEGVRPECRPSDQDISRMKARYHYSPEFFHIAVVGSAGAGKSSFINAVRGLSNKHPMAAPTGIVETTQTVTSYPDPSPNSRVIWYDVPGTGTPKVPEWQYFNDMGLYVFDCIIVLTDNRVLDSDLAILRACEQFNNIESLIVRSKSDQHINNMVCERMPPGFDLGDPGMDDETRSLFLQTKSEERHRFIDETCQNVRMHLGRENPSPKKVYIVCMDAMRAIVIKSRSTKAIDEAEFLNDVKGFMLTRLEAGC
ncbi:interferon-inducible GTPase-domain-containing protein [Suillus clintonianus]|uniref:interferon-inducible GTPase-domain-containing protein n=1 Tax=Suillus clintonianus TaxID=1904413 RepID=UPI001B86B2F2|nr:interferon-inducible GTPase-domain-containing protein [Suillus clintonianus]KAG2136700.1 interferon-inducible GTPase-domain-containing protein [Suillus clintonianus]